MTAAVRIGLVGYGVGGRWFHAPFIDAAEGAELAGVVARSADKVELIGREHPGVPVHASLTEMLAGRGVDAVVITTPPSTHRDLALEAIAAGVPVVVDKPFMPDPATAREVRDAAAAAGVPLAVFHNRRWDADLTTLRSVLPEIGEPVVFHSLFDLVERHGIATGDGGGVLNDLGAHLVDQAVSILGPITSVTAEFDMRVARDIDVDADGDIDAGFFIAATHASGARSHLESDKAGWGAMRRLRLVGTEGTYESTATDVQAQAAIAGRTPSADREAWGYEPTPGTLSTRHGERPVPSEQGDYTRYYEQFAAAVRGEGPLPVTADEAVHVVDVVDAARRSATEGVRVEVPRA